MEKFQKFSNFDFAAIDVAPCKYDERYLVFSNGMLYNSKFESFIVPGGNGAKSKYLSYNFYPKGKKTKKVYLHRLVAEHFLDNPDNLRDVHHKDNNPLNNDVSNLQWLSHQDNCLEKEPENPMELIKKRPNAYLTKIKTGQYVLCYKGRYHGIPQTRKYVGRCLESAKLYRNKFFQDYNCVA